MSALDYSCFLMSDKCKRIKTQNCAMKSSSHRVKFGIATVTLAFTFFCLQTDLLPKQMTSMTSGTDLERILTHLHKRWEAAHKPCTNWHLSDLLVSLKGL